MGEDPFAGWAERYDAWYDTEGKGAGGTPPPGKPGISAAPSPNHLTFLARAAKSLDKPVRGGV